MNRLCLKLSENESLRKLIGLPTKQETPEQSYQLLFDFDEDYKNKSEVVLQDFEIYKRMEDVEYVLRFFAMRQVEGFTNLKLYEFLDYYLQKANQFSQEVIDELATLFIDTITFADELLGKESFYLWRNRSTVKGELVWYWFSRSTTTVYDPLMFALTTMLSRKHELLAQKNKIKDKLIVFYESNYSSFEGRNSNKNDIIKRRELYCQFFESIVGE